MRYALRTALSTTHYPRIPPRYARQDTRLSMVRYAPRTASSVAHYPRIPPRHARQDTRLSIVRYALRTASSVAHYPRIPPRYARQDTRLSMVRYALRTALALAPNWVRRRLACTKSLHQQRSILILEVPAAVVRSAHHTMLNRVPRGA